MRSSPRTTLLIHDARQTVLGAGVPPASKPLSYSAFGWRQAVPALPALGFNGQRAEVLTGAYYLGHGNRLYNPVLHRFHSSDSLSPFAQGGLNSYAYCLGDPVNYHDPSGAEPEWLMPALTIFGNSAAFGAILFAGVLGRPKGFGLWGVRMTIVGAPLAVVGASLQLAGFRDTGRPMSIAGSALSGLGSSMRLVKVVKNLLRKTDAAEHFRGGLRHVFGLSPKRLKTPKTPETASTFVQSPPTTATGLGSHGKKSGESVFTFSPPVHRRSSGLTEGRRGDRVAMSAVGQRGGSVGQRGGSNTSLGDANEAIRTTRL